MARNPDSLKGWEIKVMENGLEDDDLVRGLSLDRSRVVT